MVGYLGLLKLSLHSDPLVNAVAITPLRYFSEKTWSGMTICSHGQRVR